MRSLALAFLAISFSSLALGCDREAEQKVKRWASEAPKPQARTAAPDPLAEPIAERESRAPTTAPAPSVQPVAASPPPPDRVCTRVVERACRALGIHSDECREGRDLIPDPVPPATRAACVRVFEEHQELMSEADWPEGKSPCLLMIRRVCQRDGYKSPSCGESKAAARLLTSAKRKQACVGQLILLELREALSLPGSG